MKYINQVDARREIAWAKRRRQKGKPVQVATLRSGRLSKAHRLWLTTQGVAGHLADLIHSHSRGYRLVDAFERSGWPGVQAVIMGLESPIGKKALMETILFSRWGFRIDECLYKQHWYVRQPRGRRPKYCPLHSRAARQNRYRMRKIFKKGGPKAILAMVKSPGIRRAQQN